MADLVVYIPGLHRNMVKQQARQLSTPIKRSSLTAGEQVEARYLLFVLSQTLTGTALLTVMNVAGEDPDNGYE